MLHKVLWVEETARKHEVMSLDPHDPHQVRHKGAASLIPELLQ